MTGARPGEELATLLRLVSPADGPVQPLVALPWAPAGGGAAQLVRQVARRTRAAASAHAGSLVVRQRMRVVRPVRGSLRPGLRDRLRRRAGSGYVAYRPVPGRPAMLDVVLGDTGGELMSPLALGADGAVRATLRRNGVPGLLRLGLAGSPADPAHAVAGLGSLAALSSPLIPRILLSGRSDDVSWALEELLPGSRPETLAPALLDQLAGFLAGLPTGADGLALREDAETIAAVAPRAAATLRTAAETVAGSRPAARPQLRHGDLWAGNLLVRDDALTGVVDWDAWLPAGVPAVDLLHVLGTETRIRTRASLGEVWLRRPWDDASFVGLLTRHWPEWGGDAESRAQVGVAWWLGQLAADLRRNPALGADPVWVGRNITAVANVLP